MKNLFTNEVKTEITNRWLNASEALRGTIEWNKYYVETAAKINNRWVFTGWAPITRYTVNKIDMYIKKYKDTTYLMIEVYDSFYGDSLERYTLTPDVIELISDLIY